MSPLQEIDRSSFDPFDLTWLPRIYEVDAQLRRDAPVTRPHDGIVYLVRYEDCKEVLRDVRSFRSAGGMRAPGVEVPHDELLFNEMDPPLHPRMRRLLIEAFRPDAIEQLSDFLAGLAADRVDALAAARTSGGEPVDLVSGLTIPMGNVSTVKLLGFPLADAERIVAWTKEVMHSDWPSYNRRDRDAGATGIEGFPEFRDYVDSAVAERRANASNDLISRFTEVEIEGARLSDIQARTAVAHMFLAGISTATNLMGNVLYELLREPELYGRIRADRSLVPVAIEESLRFRSPVNFLTRAVAVDTEIAGEKVHAGERVMTSLASSGRDEAVFGDDADRFRLDRAGAPAHLAFAPGAHYCVGRTLARMEAAAAIDAVLDRFERLELVDGFAFENVPVPFEWGPLRLDVTAPA